LEAGASGVFKPRIETESEGTGRHREHRGESAHGVREVPAREPVCFALIEMAASAANAAGIAQVHGIDGLFVEPRDLSPSWA
jgi:2-keto-3-deoxy-L-rhamnonate aldolase RhmA